MQDETQAPGAEAATQESNETPDPGAAANPGGSEGLGQEQPSGEGPAAALPDQGGSPFLGVDETSPPTGDVDEIEMPPDYVGTPPPDPVEQAGAPAAAAPAEATAPADPAVGGAAVDAGAVGEQAGGEAVDAALYSPGMGNPAPSAPAKAVPEAAAAEATAPDEDLLSEPPPPETRVDSEGKVWVPKDAYDKTRAEADEYSEDYWRLWDERYDERMVETVADAAEDVGESVVDFVEGIPVIGDDVGDALGEAYDVVEDVVDHADDPVVEDVDPWG